MFKNKAWISGGLLGVLLITAGCGAAASNSTGSASTGTSAGTAATASVSSADKASTPAAVTTVAQGNADQGKQLFVTNCAGCHSVAADKVVGPGLKGIFHKDKLPNGQTVNDTNIRQWIKTGDASMPGNPALSDSDLASLVAYLKTL